MNPECLISLNAWPCLVSSTVCEMRLVWRGQLEFPNDLRKPYLRRSTGSLGPQTRQVSQLKCTAGLVGKLSGMGATVGYQSAPHL